MMIQFEKPSFVSKFLHFYYKVHILLCIDFGCMNLSSKWNRIMRAMCLVFSTAYSIYSYINACHNPNWVLNRYFVYIFTYLGLVYNLTLRERGATLNDLKNRLRGFDLKIGFHGIDAVEKRELVMNVCIYIYRIVWSLYYCLIGQCFRPMWFSVSFGFILTGVEVFISTYSFLLYAIKYRLKQCVSNIKNGFDIENQHKLYKEVADFTENVVNSYEVAFSLNLLINIISLLLGMYTNIFMVFRHEDMDTDMIIHGISTGINICIKLFISLGPAVCASMLSAEVEKIRIIMYEKLLIEKDDIKCRKLKAFIGYIECRPLKFTVYKVIPLDASLLGVVFSFCVTYLIVIVQFAHFI